MNIVGDKTEADYAKLTEQAGTITSRKKTQIGYSFLAMINHDGAEAGFAMLKEHPQFVTLVAQTGYFSVIRCD